MKTSTRAMLSPKAIPPFAARATPVRFTVAADRFEGYLGPDGWVERIIADGGVTGTRKSPAGTDNFSSGHVEFALEPQHNILREMTATGGVTAQSQKGAVSQLLNTAALRVKFAPGEPGRPAANRLR